MANKKRRSSKKSADNGSGPKKARDESPAREYSLECREPAHTMEDLVGLDDIKAGLRKAVIVPFLASKAEAKEFGLEAPRGILLTGAPGTGKTVLAEAIVNELNMNSRLKTKVKFFKETGQCLTKWFGETEANLRSLFAKARSSAPSVIFFDEIDGIARPRDGGGNSNTASLLTTLLEEMNKVEIGQVLVIAATNCSNLVDAALLRTGRFDLKFSIPIPDANTRKELFTHYLAKKKYKIQEQTMERMVDETATWTGSDVKGFVNYLNFEIVDRMFPNMSFLTTPLNIKKKKMADNRLITLNHLLPILMEWKQLKETSRR